MCNIFSKVTCQAVKDPGMGMKTKIKIHLIFHAKNRFKEKESVKFSIQTFSIHGNSLGHHGNTSNAQVQLF
jgi:hypothetical protein